jgi:protein-S-isoprenylcysteine O-methyltransferase Ste14
MDSVLRLLARRRVPIGFITAVIVLWLARPTRWSLAIGAMLGACGEALRIWAAGHLEKSREVTTSGPYRFVRHPLYVGSTIMGAGVAVAANSLAIAVLVLGYLAVTLTAAIRTEEAHLTEKFGNDYPDYRNGRVSDARRFSLARAMRNREYRALAGFLAVLAVLAWKASR